MHRVLKHFHTNLIYDVILLSFVEVCYRFPSSLRRGRTRKEDAGRETHKQEKYRLKKCIWSWNLKERKVCSVMTSFHASLGNFLGLYLSGTSSLKLGLCVLGIQVCFCRWDKGLTYKSQWQYQVKKSLQGLLALSVGNTITVFHDIVQHTEHKQEKALLSTSPICWFNTLFLSTTKCLFSWLSNLRIFLQVKFKISEILVDSLLLFL